MAFAGTVGFLTGAASTLGLGAHWLHTEFPLGAAEGLAVAADGTVYVGSRAYRRIQSYDREGRFRQAWFLPALKGTWQLALTDDEELLVSIGGSKPQVSYLLQGGELRRTPDPTGLAPTTDWGTRTFRREGRSYVLRPIPIAVFADGKPLFRQNIVFTLLMAPLPSFFIAVLGYLAYIVGSRGSRAIPGSPPTPLPG